MSTSEQDSCCSSSAENDNGGEVDLAVIGAGSAGFSAAMQGAELGARVALIGHGTIRRHLCQRRLRAVEDAHSRD